jgi:hypothetical protein
VSQAYGKVTRTVASLSYGKGRRNRYLAYPEDGSMIL